MVDRDSSSMAPGPDPFRTRWSPAFVGDNSSTISPSASVIASFRHRTCPESPFAATLASRSAKLRGSGSIATTLRPLPARKTVVVPCSHPPRARLPGRRMSSARSSIGSSWGRPSTNVFRPTISSPVEQPEAGGRPRRPRGPRCSARHGRRTTRAARAVSRARAPPSRPRGRPSGQSRLALRRARACARARTGRGRRPSTRSMNVMEIARPGAPISWRHLPGSKDVC